MNATDKFVSNVGQIIRLSEIIKNHAGNHFDRDPDKINWSDVGDTGHVIELLEQITEFLGLDVTNITSGQ